jgi:hypothetical protein
LLALPSKVGGPSARSRPPSEQAVVRPARERAAKRDGAARREEGMSARMVSYEIVALAADRVQAAGSESFRFSPCRVFFAASARGAPAGCVAVDRGLREIDTPRSHPVRVAVDPGALGGAAACAPDCPIWNGVAPGCCWQRVLTRPTDRSRAAPARPWQRTPRARSVCPLPRTGRPPRARRSPAADWPPASAAAPRTSRGARRS